MKKLILLIGLFLMFSFSLQAKEIYYGSAPEFVTISKETIFRFHKQVRTISQAHRFEIRPADVNDPDYSMLSIRPRFSKGTTKVAFVLSDGSVVNLKLKIVKNKGGNTEPFYDLKPKSMLIERSEQSLPVLTVMDFMKSIDRDDNIVGYKRKVVSKKVSTGYIKGVSAKLVRVYTGKDYKGFVIELRNKYRTKSYKTQLDELRFKSSNQSIISLVDDEILVPKGKGNHRTTLKVVAKPTASIDDIVLPIKLLVEKKEAKI
jgi:hypothetical protein